MVEIDDVIGALRELWEMAGMSEDDQEHELTMVMTFAEEGNDGEFCLACAVYGAICSAFDAGRLAEQRGIDP